MATAPPRSQTVGKVVQYEAYIDQQIAKTSFHVKVVDVVAGLLELALVVLGVLLVLVVVDHWIIGLGFWTRLCSLVGLTVTVAYLLVTRVMPPLIRSVNPVYAAQTVEKSFPSLKNGLINFLFFREHRSAIRSAVYQGVQKQAATKLAEVPIDTAVDRSMIIRLGYALVAVVAVWCGYILFSPKDPLQTVSRVALPWREIARPSKVLITAVNPGHADIFRGEDLTVTAVVEGLKGDEVPAIEFSSLDGQINRERLPMSPNSSPGRYEGLLTTGEAGIQQDLEYRLIAGDAVSPTYRVQTSEAPHIIVERIQYEYPKYTALPTEVVQGEGDIRAIEGTRVTVFGKANQAIASGSIRLLPPMSEDVGNGSKAAKNGNPAEIKSAPLRVDGEQGQVSFRLRLSPDRQRSVYRGYQLEFLNEQLIPSQDPVEHSIEVTPDLRPIVQILTPSKRTVEIPENGWQEIEIRAVDPDFALTKVQLGARTRSQVLLRQDLLSETRSGQVVLTYNFVPREHELRAGDVVEIVAMAEDNRHSPLKQQPEPNQTTSAKHFLRIVAADPVAEREPPPGRDQFPADEPQAEEKPTPADQQPPAGSDQNQADDASSEQRQQSGGEGPSQSDANQLEEQQQPDESSGESGLKQDGNDGGQSRQQDLESGQSGESGSDSEDSQRQGEAGSASQDGTREPNDRDAASSGGPNREPDDQTNENQGRGARPDEPLPSDGSRDGEVVERIQEHMRQQGESTPSTDGGSETGESKGDGGRAEDQASEDSSVTDESSQDTPGETNGQAPENTKPTEGQTEAAEQPADAKSTDASSPPDGDEPQAGKGSTSPGEQENQPHATDQEESGNKPAEDAQSEGASPQPQDGRDTKPAAEQTAEATEGTDESGDNSSEQRGGPSDIGEPGQGADQGSEESNPTGKTDDKAPPSESERPPSESGDPGNNRNGSPSTPESGGQQRPDDSQRDRPSRQTGGGEGDSASLPADAAGQGQTGAEENEPGGDEANVEYAKKATDLVLEYLRDQKDSPDRELLDKLGWTKEDMQRFLRRWEDLKRRAGGSDADAEKGARELDDVLRSMGLRPPQNELRRTEGRDDRQRGNRETGRRVQPPADLVDQYRDFLKSLQLGTQ